MFNIIIRKLSNFLIYSTLSIINIMDAYKKPKKNENKALKLVNLK